MTKKTILKSERIMSDKTKAANNLAALTIRNYERYYYHITSYDQCKMKSILSNGLISNYYGNIFLFENKAMKINGVQTNISDYIAATQIFVDEYLMFRIDSQGITNGLIRDNVRELSWRQQWIAKQRKIEPKYIKCMGIWNTKFEPYY